MLSTQNFVAAVRRCAAGSYRLTRVRRGTPTPPCRANGGVGALTFPDFLTIFRTRGGETRRRLNKAGRSVASLAGRSPQSVFDYGMNFHARADNPALVFRLALAESCLRVLDTTL